MVPHELMAFIAGTESPQLKVQEASWSQIDLKKTRPAYEDGALQTKRGSSHCHE